MTILVTGGAGYIGSHAVQALLEAGHGVVVFDNLQQGHRAAVPAGVRLIEADLADVAAVDAVLAGERFEAVLHFAANSLVGESMRRPFGYLGDNVTNSVRLIEACVRHGILKFVLSSTASIFGTPERMPITEDTAIDPGSPYGESKYLIERALVWADRVCGVKSACLRYFNAAGAHPNGQLGEDHNPETHLIPIILDVARGRRACLDIFGDDYPTPDGTCVRDYIHVSDLADAHVRVIAALDTGSCRYNLGTGTGYSVRQVVTAARRVTGAEIPVRISPRRPGDPPVLIASSERIRRALDWQPRFPDLDTIIASAWTWRQRHPEGYGREPV